MLRAASLQQLPLFWNKPQDEASLLIITQGNTQSEVRLHSSGSEIPTSNAHNRSRSLFFLLFNKLLEIHL